MKYTKVVLVFLTTVLLWKGQLFCQHLMHYTSEEYEYSIMLPEDWQRTDKIKNPNIALVLQSEEGATLSVSFYESREVELPGFIDQYHLSMSGDLKDVNLEQKGSIKAKDGMVDYLVIDYTKKGKSIREKVCFYKRTEEIAVVSSSSEKENFHLELPIYDQIFKSFTFETSQDKVEGED